MTSNAFLQMCKKKDGVEDETLKLANENIKLAQQLEEDATKYTEDVNPTFQEQQIIATQCIETIEAR